MTRVCIARHGNTFLDAEPARRIGARTDLPLVTAGRAQAAALARHFAREGFGFDRILAGPLARTTQTATIIADALDAPRPEPATWLTEIDHGPDEDRPEADVIARIGAEALARWDSDATPPPGWTVEREDRIAAWHAFLRTRTDAPAPALLVTSNGAARFARLAIDAAGAMKLRTGAYGLLVHDGARWTVADWDVRP